MWFILTLCSFLVLLFSYLLVQIRLCWLEKKKCCHLSHCCSRQQGQVEEFILEEQCSWGVSKQRSQFDVSTSPRWTKKLHPQSREVDNCGRRSSEAGSRSVTGGLVQAVGGFLYCFGLRCMFSPQIQTDKRKQEPRMWLQRLIIEAASCDCLFFVNQCMCLSALTVCQLFPHTHTPKKPSPSLLVTMDTKAQDLKLSLPVMCTPDWQIRKRSFSTRSSLENANLPKAEVHVI